MSYDDNSPADEIDVSYDDFIENTTARNREDSERAQSAGESRQLIKEFLEQTGLNSKSYSFLRSILKQKKYATQMDMIRSIKEALPHVEAYIMGNGGMSDMFDKADEAQDEDQVDFDGGKNSGNVRPFGTEKSA